MDIIKVNEEELALAYNENLGKPIVIGDYLNYNGQLYLTIKFTNTKYGVYLVVREVLSNGELSDEKEISQSDIQYYKNLGSKFNYQEFNADVKALLNGDYSITDIGNRLEAPTESNSTEIMTLNSNILVQKKEHLEKVNKYLEAVSAKAKSELQSKLEGLNTMVSGFRKTIKKINKLIFTIELYEGMSEDIVVLKTGANADSSEPMSLRQRKLFMDEEVGDPTDDGIDFTNIEFFDEWLFKWNTYWKCYNYEFIIPEKKCVVVLGIRRSEKNYSTNPFINQMMNEENELCYLLIRNGDNFYRIYSDLKIGDNMFPEKNELMNLQEQYDKERFDSNKDKIDDKVDRYKFNMILLQGIIERTDCFPNEKHTVSLFKMNDDMNINFIYDNDRNNLLNDSRPTYNQWVSMKNADTNVGSQILWFDSTLIRVCGLFSPAKYRMFNEYHYYDERYPKNPETGIYQLEVVKFKERHDSEEKDRLFFKYEPNRNKWWEEDLGLPKKRVKRVSFMFEKSDDYINYDNITRDDLETLDYYTHTRIGRQSYLHRIPKLIEIKKLKEAEFAKEDEFIRLSLTQSGLNPVKDFQIGVDAMHWWKVKNKWKRTLSTDDAKALRMIVSKLKKENGTK